MMKSILTAGLLALGLPAIGYAEMIEPPSQDTWVASKKYVQINDQIKMAYVEWGDSDAEPVLLIHGYSDNSRAFSTIAPYLMDKHYFAIDLRGHGDSSKPDCCYYMGDFAEDASAFIHKMGWKQVDVVGHSLGSLTAGVLASNHPDEVKKLVLVSSALKISNSTSDWIMGELNKATYPMSPDSDFIKEWASVPDSVDPVMMEHLRHEEVKLPESAWKGIVKGLQVLDWSSAARHITAPTMILWGDQDPMMSESDQQALQAALPEAEFHRYDGLGHSMYWEEPERIAKDLQAFLDK